MVPVAVVHGVEEARRRRKSPSSRISTLRETAPYDTLLAHTPTLLQGHTRREGERHSAMRERKKKKEKERKILLIRARAVEKDHIRMEDKTKMYVMTHTSRRRMELTHTR